MFALSSCGSPEYEKAIADWLQTDENGTWTDLKFELMLQFPTAYCIWIVKLLNRYK